MKRMTKIIIYTDKKVVSQEEQMAQRTLLERKKARHSLLTKNAFMQSKNLRIYSRMDGRFFPLQHIPQIQV